MAAEIVNLRKARKQRERAAKVARADENRAKSGRTRSDRAQSETSAARDRRHLDGHRIDSASGQEEPQNPSGEDT